MLYNNNNIDEELQKLEAICNNASNKYNFYWTKIEVETEQGLVIHQDLVDELNQSITDLKNAIFDLHTLQKHCAIHKINLTAYWIRLGFPPDQISVFSEQSK